MTLEQILEAISPYVNVAGITALVTAVISIAVKIYGTVKKASANLSQTVLIDEKKIAQLISSQLPTKLDVAIKPLVESELKKINENVMNAASALSDKTTVKMDAIAKAIASMRALPDAQRQELLNMLEAEHRTPDTPQVTLQYEVSNEVKALAEDKSQAPATQNTEVYVD